MPKSRAAWLLAALFALPASGEADLVTDRPDQTESATLAPVGTVQVEAGVQATSDALEVPGTLLRWRVSPAFELRLAWPGHLRVDRGPRGLGDPALGLKLGLASRPELALIAHLTLPVGEEGVGSPRVDPSVRLAAAHTLARRIGLGWNVGWEAASSRDAVGQTHTLARWVYTAAVGFELNDAWGTFVEVFGDLPASDPGRAAHSLDAGLTFLVSPRVQLDLAGGLGLENVAPDAFVGAGISVRWPR